MSFERDCSGRGFSVRWTARSRSACKRFRNEAKKTQQDDNVRTTRIEKGDFNIYGLEWDTERIVFLVNGKNTFTYKRDAGKGPDQWPFHHPMYIILSMQIGGSWVGDANPQHYPAYMEVDWVKVYARE